MDEKLPPTTDMNESIEPIPNIEHQKFITDRLNDDRTEEARGRDIEAFPPGYWYSPTFIGSFCVRTSLQFDRVEPS